jgi:hypothetical protein
MNHNNTSAPQPWTCPRNAVNGRILGLLRRVLDAMLPNRDLTAGVALPMFAAALRVDSGFFDPQASS